MPEGKLLVLPDRGPKTEDRGQVPAPAPAPRKLITCTLVPKPVLVSRDVCACGQQFEVDDQEAIKRLAQGHRLFSDCPQCGQPIEFALSRVAVPRPEPTSLVDLSGKPLK